MVSPGSMGANMSLKTFQMPAKIAGILSGSLIWKLYIQNICM